VKLELCPEDMLLEYVEHRLTGRVNLPIKHEAFLKDLPRELELSEEFAVRWQAMVEPAIRRFVASTFALRGFTFEVDGYTRRFTAAEPAFWNDMEFRFSHRGAERLYEQMLWPVTGEQPLLPVVLPADALLVSICRNDFSAYSFPWLAKNGGNWLIKACMVAWQQVGQLCVPWQCFFNEPAGVELPLREYLVERAADYVAACNEELLRQYPGATAHTPRPARGLPISLDKILTELPDIYKHVKDFVAAVRKAIAYWAGEGCVCIDDERYIAGAAAAYGLESEFAVFEAAAGTIVEKMTSEEQIYESLIHN